VKGYYVQRMNSGALRDSRNHLIRKNRAGAPDIMAFKLTVDSWMCTSQHEILDLLFIEVKRPGNKPTALRKAVMAELESFGARSIVAHSMQEVENALHVL
jgi:hypothetical protein